tara:strand:- start:3966 stop:5576 length:1611 start_codon:yes stop_codon:yes gene_type:complete
MTVFTRDQVPLDDDEICIIKGLLKHRAQLTINQQRIIAYFSFPRRTVHHNVVSAIARNTAGTSGAHYPPADIDACRRFLARWDGSWVSHWLAVAEANPYGTQEEALIFGYRFHPVGQGLFCSGHFCRSGQPPFRWVYDCGTEQGTRGKSRKKHVQNEIANLQDEVNGDRLDLVTLSHFDEDHLSGLIDLLNVFRVGTLLLPYLTPWDRLIVALSQGAADGSDLLAFLRGPTAFLLERFEGRIERILLVPPNGEGGEAMPPAPPADPFEPWEESEARPPIVIKDAPPYDEDGDDGFGADLGLSNSSVRMLHSGGYILVSRAWEFVPYNDCRLDSLGTESFKDAARPLAKKLIDEAEESERQAALEELMTLYDETFKSPGSKKISARRRNEISLFLYAGPIGDVVLDFAHVSIPRHRMAPSATEVPPNWVHTDRFGQMLSGDGYLHTQEKIDKFCQFFSIGDRLRRGAIFQVMHHGSEGNWRVGLADQISPVASIFSSDPLGKLGHPSASVVSDFAPYHPVQVDGEHGWRAIGIYRFL